MTPTTDRLIREAVSGMWPYRHRPETRRAIRNLLGWWRSRFPALPREDTGDKT